MSAPFGPAIQLYGYQQAYLLDKSRFKLGMFARQTGKTFTTTLDIVDDVMEGLTKGRRQPWVILSRGERQAAEAMNEGIKRHAAAYNLGFDSLNYEWVGEQTRVNAFEVVFPNDTKVTALPANPDTARGYSRNVFLDEFAIHQNSREIWAALFPIISAGWKMRVTSTPKGKGNKFYELVTGRDDAWSRHIVDIVQAVRDGLPRDVEQLRAALNDEDLWQQEFMLQFLDEASAWLTFELIASVEDDGAGDPSGYQGGPCYVGVDIARRRDLFVIWVWERVGDVLVTRAIVERKGITFAEQDALLDNVFRFYRVVRCCMDQTGMGEKPVEDAQRRYGTTRVEGVLMSAPTQLRLATLSKERFQDRTIRIPAGRPELRADLHKLRKEVGVTGVPRFVADRDAGGHADRAWAAFLGIGAADSPAEVYGYEPASRPSGQGAALDAFEDGVRERGSLRGGVVA